MWGLRGGAVGGWGSEGWGCGGVGVLRGRDDS